MIDNAGVMYANCLRRWPNIKSTLTMWFRMSMTPFFVKYCLIGQIQNRVKFMNTSTEHILQCNQSEQLADASGRIVDLMAENDFNLAAPSKHDAMTQPMILTKSIQEYPFLSKK